MKFIANYIERFTFEAKDVILSLIVRCEVITGYCSAQEVRQLYTVFNGIPFIKSVRT